MAKLLTSDQFVAGIMSVLALQGRRKFVLSDTDLDRSFERAYEALAAQQDALGITPNFTFYLEALHGDSGALRDTLLAARDKRILAFENPSFHYFEIKLTTQRAERYLESSPLPQQFLEAVANECFRGLAAD